MRVTARRAPALGPKLGVTDADGPRYSVATNIRRGQITMLELRDQWQTRGEGWICHANNCSAH